ncbi:MAG: hypothetical protein NT041_01720, partial [Candidatus Vogelbacteria bacterium]|nr:hypothetical protein [Candidatus Vogelbacteria bacterium]
MKTYFLCSLLLTLFFISAGAIRAEQNLGKVTITSISGPTYVNTGETVNWTINAQTTSRGNTAYFVDWQDGLQKLNAKPSLTPVFSHLFVKDGVYDVVFGVT